LIGANTAGDFGEHQTLQILTMSDTEAKIVEKREEKERDAESDDEDRRRSRRSRSRSPRSRSRSHSRGA